VIIVDAISPRQRGIRVPVAVAALPGVCSAADVCGVFLRAVVAS
jgi:hypothetical protein